MKLRILPFAAALMLSSTPAAAQDLGALLGTGADNPITMFKELFKAEPLTPAEQARLPAAQQVADKLMPPGVYGRMLEEAFSPMADKVLAMVEPGGSKRVAKLTDLLEDDLKQVDKADQDAIVALLDPRADQRNQQMIDIAFREMGTLMLKIEPFYRDGLAKAYARHFSDAELAEINAFFATPTGTRYAERSMSVYLDPQVMAKIPDMVPVLVGSVTEAATRVVMEMDTIPQPTKVADLGKADKAKLLKLLGMTEEEYDNLAGRAEEYDWESDASDSDDGDWGEEVDGGLSESAVDGGLEPVN